MINMLRRGRFWRARLFMLRISGTRRPGRQGLSWRKLVQCQLEFSWATGQSSVDTTTMFETVRMMWRRSQLQVWHSAWQKWSCLNVMQHHPTLVLATNLRFLSLHRQHLLRHPLKQVLWGHALCGKGPDLETWKTTCINRDFITGIVVEMEDK